MTVNAFLILSGQNKDRNKHCLASYYIIIIYYYIYIHPPCIAQATPAPPPTNAPGCILYNEIITYFRVFYDVGVVKICITRLNNSQVRARATSIADCNGGGVHTCCSSPPFIKPPPQLRLAPSPSSRLQ